MAEPLVVPFPTTARPGRRPGEGQGDLVNCFAKKIGPAMRWQRVPGLSRWTSAMPGVAPRGQLAVDTNLLSVWGNKLFLTRLGGGPDSSQPLNAFLEGTGPVTMARNLRQQPDIVIVTSAGVYVANLDSMQVEPYPGAGPGAVNSVAYYAGYFIFARSGGELVASELQSTEIDPLSFARAESAPDGLSRVFAAPPVLLACGSDTIEVYQDAATTPFPLAKVTVIPIGLFGPWAIAGGAAVWDRDVLLVASDYTVRQLAGGGYEPQIVSTDDVSADIYSMRGNPGALVAGVHVAGPDAFWTLSSPTWCWVLNLSTGFWHRRRSYQPSQQQTDAPVTWRARFPVLFGGSWVAQDLLAGGLVEVMMGFPTEDGQPLICRCESAPVADFPANIRLPAVYFNFVVAVGQALRPAPFETDPVVMISWSHNGGATWSNPLRRGLGAQGETRTLIAVRNLGRSSAQGVRLRWEVVDPVPVRFYGAIVPSARASRPRQVGVVTTGGSYAA